MATLTKADLKKAFRAGFLHGFGSTGPLPTMAQMDEAFQDWYEPKKPALRDPNAEIDKWLKGESSQPPILEADWMKARQKP